MLAFPNAAQPGLITLGPHSGMPRRSVHHRVAWLARESSKPGRDLIERWTIQASAAWSQEHLEDAPERVEAKLLKAFSEITGISATPCITPTCTVGAMPKHCNHLGLLTC
jgi:renalase